MSTYSWFVRGEKHAALCQVSMAAVRRIDKRAELVVATDEAGLTIPGASMLRFEPGLPLMVANIEAQIQVLQNRIVPVVFLDTDVLFLKPFPVPDREELVVTWRDTVGGQIEDIPGGVADAMPYNYGVLSALPGIRTIEAFIWIRERIRKMSPGLQQWWGNQIALAALCGRRPSEGVSDEIRHIPWNVLAKGPALRVKKIPGSMWNYTPSDENEDVSWKGAIHFKGHTRGWMRGFAERLELPWKEAA